MATMATMPTVLVVSPGKGYKTVADLVAAAKAKPGELVASPAGIGSSTHMNLERFRISAGIEVLHVPLQGRAGGAHRGASPGAPTSTSPWSFQVGANVKDGKLLALAVGSPKRSALLPDVPTTVEAGYPELGLQLLGRRAGRVENTARDRRAPEPGDQRGGQFARGEGAFPEARRRSADHVAAGVRGHDPRRIRVQRAADQGGGHQARVTEPTEDQPCASSPKTT